jgi:hypothetical protein
MSLFCLFTWSLAGCSGLTARTSGQQAGQPGDKANDRPAAGQASPTASDPTPKDAVDQLVDTAKLQADMNSVLNSIASGKPDTNALKKAGKDFLTTSHDMLSDSGIDRLYGNSNDPAVKAAAEMLKKYRNATGLTPDKLDSLKKAADLLKAN